jgi:arylsulfatase A-like enzyme
MWTLGVMLIFVTAAVFQNACRQVGSRRPDKLIIIVADTLRADHLSCYGYAARQTPRIDELAAAGVRFTQAVSAIPETGPAVSSILTGKYPYSHGARANTWPLPSHAVTLAQVLRKQGYRTAAFSDTFPFRQLKIFKGFDHFEKREPGFATLPQAIQSAVDRPVKWMRQHRSESFVVLIHFYDPHLPYAPLERSPETESLQYAGLYTGEYGPAMTLWDGRYEVDEADVAFMRSLYDDEVGQVDAYVGALLDATEDMGIGDQAVIVFTADHGESFGEHAYYFDHGDYLYEDQIHVPLIFRCDSLLPAGVAVDSQVRSIDIMPTALQLLGVEHKGRIDGVSLAPLFKGKKRLLGTRYALSESDAINFINPNCRGYINGIKGKHLSLRREGKKLIYVPGHPDTPLEMYDLVQDPGEEIDLVSIHPEITREMFQQLKDLMAQMAASPGEAERIDRQTEAILKSLGYIHK